MSGLEIPTLMMFAGTAASAGSQMMAAGEKSAAAQFESEQYQRQAEAAKTASMQEETSRRRDLNSNLQTIMAIRAGRGVGESSPTAMAIYNNTIDKSEDEIATSKANYAAKADLARRAAILSERKSRTSLFAGAVGALGTVGSAAYRYSSLNFPKAPAGRSIGDPTQIGSLY